MELKKGFKQFLIRLGIFAALGYIIIPFLIPFLANTFGYTKHFRYSYTYLDVFVGAVAIAFLILKRDELLKLNPYNNNKTETIAMSIVAAIFFYMSFYSQYRINLNFLTANPSITVIFMFLFYGLGYLSLGLAIFNTTLLNKFSNSIISSLAVISAFFVSILVFNIYWRFFANAVAKASALLLNLSYSNVVLSFVNKDPLLGASNFTVSIGAPCSGITSMSMFMGLFILISIFDYKKLNKQKIPQYFIIGLAGMFLVAILRVYILMIIGASFSPEIALNAFHNNAGCFFFISYLLGYWYIVYPKLFDRKSRKTL